MLKNNKKLFIGLTIILLGILIQFNINEKDIIIKENNIISKYLKDSKPNQINDYIAIIEIPKISLKKELYSINSKQNNVNKNIQIIKEEMPNIPNGNLVLASHSGNSLVSYFKNINKLHLNDIIFIYYNNKKYTYKIVNIYDVPKLGYIDIYRNNNKNILTLITCKKTDKHKQLVIISELI